MVVTLRHVTRRGKRQRRVYDFTHKYVRARTPETAAQVARRNHFGRKRSAALGQVGDPTDLWRCPGWRHGLIAAVVPLDLSGRSSGLSSFDMALVVCPNHIRVGNAADCHQVVDRNLPGTRQRPR